MARILIILAAALLISGAVAAKNANTSDNRPTGISAWSG